MLSERRARLVDCIAQKNCARLNNKWEQQYAEFERWVGMPAVKSKLHNWQHNQLGTGSGCLYAKIQKQRMKRVPCGVIRERDLLFARNKDRWRGVIGKCIGICCAGL